MARTAKYGNELLSERVMLTLTPSQLQELKERVGKGDLSHYMRERILERDLSRVSDGFDPVPVLGYIHAGDAMDITHLPAGTTSRPPFALAEGCYGLITIGDSMTREYGLSIPEGSYAYFCPGLMARHGDVVHVEWPKSDGEHECTLKRYRPNPDGTVTFEPFNKKHKPITKKEGEFVIRGIFVRAWDGGSVNEN